MNNDRMALSIVLGLVALIVVAGLAFYIGWSAGFNYGQQEMCDQMVRPWEWRECY